jgi:hypothetical protein
MLVLVLKCNNEKLWDYLAEYFHGTPAFVWIKAFLHRNGKDGRGAWQNVYSHYCGDQQLRRVREEAMCKLATIHYEGEKRHFGYKKYCRAHVICHADLERTSADGVPMSETDKCMYFINGLRHPMMAYHAHLSGQLDTFHALEQFCGTFVASIRREDRNGVVTTTVVAKVMVPVDTVANPTVAIRTRVAAVILERRQRGGRK